MQNYLAGITRHREIAPELLSGRMDDYLALFAAAENSQAQMALARRFWLTRLAHAEEIRQNLIALGGKDSDTNSYRHSAGARLTIRSSKMKIFVKHGQTPVHKFCWFSAAGTILDGRQPRGTVGGESLAAELRRARLK